MKCSVCGCVIDQAEADRGAEAIGPGYDTLCEECALSVVALSEEDEDIE